jgi:hypothetical protein
VGPSPFFRAAPRFFANRYIETHTVYFLKGYWRRELTNWGQFVSSSDWAYNDGAITKIAGGSVHTLFHLCMGRLNGYEILTAKFCDLTAVAKPTVEKV